MSAPESFDGISPGDRVRIDNGPGPHQTGRVKKLEVAMTNDDGSPRWVFAHLRSDHDGMKIQVPTELLTVIP